MSKKPTAAPPAAPEPAPEPAPAAAIPLGTPGTVAVCEDGVWRAVPA